MTMEQTLKERLLNNKIFRTLLLFIGVFLIGLLASRLYCLSAHVYDYTVCDGIFIWDSEEKEGTFYLYHPYRDTTAALTGLDWVVWLKEGNAYRDHYLHKGYQPAETVEPVTRQDLLERFGDPEIVDVLVKNDYMTELILSEWKGLSWYIENGEYNLTPIPGKESLSYAFCKFSGNINRSSLIMQRAKHRLG